MCQLPKSARIKDPADFASLKKEGRRARSGPIALASKTNILNGDSAPSSKRIGVVLSRRVGNAVERNRIRRALREFFRCNRGLFPQGDCVIIPQPGAARLKNEEIRRHVLRALERLSSK